MGWHLGPERLRVARIRESRIPSGDRRDFFMQCDIDDLSLSGYREDCYVGSLDIQDLLHPVVFLPVAEVIT